MKNDDKIQRILEQGGNSEDKDFERYKLVFEGLKTEPTNLKLNTNFSSNVMKRIQTNESSSFGINFWLIIGISILIISGLIAVALTPTGFEIFSSILELKGYIAVFISITVLFQFVEKRFHLNVN